MTEKENRGQGKVNVVDRKFVTMLDKDTAGKLGKFYMQYSMQAGNCLMRYDDRGPRGDDPTIIPYAPSVRSQIYRGTRESGAFNHHSQLTKFKGRYYFAWSNGRIDEEAAGQRILISSSEDAIHWSEANMVVGDKTDPVVAHNCIAIKEYDGKLYIFGMKEDTSIDAKIPGMRRIDPESHEVSLYESPDGEKWEKVYTFPENFRWIFEAPRETADGHLLCVAYLKEGPAILRWPGKELREDPEIIPVLQQHGAVFPYGESTWYQTDDGTIVIFWRDEGMSCRIWVSYSADGGKTFTEPMISDMPDSMSRIYAGRLSDGRYYLCNNAFPTLLNRLHLMLLLSDDGYTFDKVYIVADDPTAQRLAGLLKENGYQYPCCLVDGDNLLVGHSVNKEDIECAIIDTTTI